MRVVEDTKVSGLRRVGRADLARSDLELSLAEASSFHEDLVCATRVSC